MKVLYLLTGNECRNGPVNGDTIRANVGASGTDQSTILVAEYLANKGFDVTIAAPNGGVPGSKIRGVIYTNMNFDGIEDKSFDVLINTLWFQDFKSLPITITKGIVSITHVPYVFGFDQIKELITENNLLYGVVHLSNWCKDLNTACAHALCPTVFEAVIPNPLMTDVIEDIMRSPQPQRNEHDCIFHAAWVRGGHLALKSIKEMGWDDGKIYIFDYLMGMHHDPQIASMGSVGKKQVLERIAQCGYFVYPLVREDGEIHKDTFACVIAEACAMGAIVITYPVAALPETYEDVVHWLPFPNDTKDLDHILTAPLSHDTAFLQNDAIKDALKFFDENPVARDKLRLKAKEFVMHRYSVERIGKMWSDYLGNFR